MSREALNSFHIHQKYWGVGGIALLWDHATVTKDGRKIYDAIFKKLSHQTNNCRFLVSINAKTICSYFLFLQGWPTVGWLSGMIWVVVEFDNEFIWLGPIATGASSVKKLAGPHRCLQARQELVLEAIPATTTHPQTGCFSVPGKHISLFQ